MAKDLYYVIDTNVIIDYDEIVPSLDGPMRALDSPTVDLSEAHLVIPSAVIRELSSFKTEKSERGKTARVVLKRLREIFESQLSSMKDMYQLQASVKIGKQELSVLPVRKDFSKNLAFRPADNDMDGQIILAALTVQHLGAAFNGTIETDFPDGIKKEVVLLSNDNGLAIRARERGIKTMRYGHKLTEPYTGRRDIVVPSELFSEFLATGAIEKAYFEEMLPNEPKLVANEFIVMSLANPSQYPKSYDPWNDPYFERIGIYDATEEKIVRLKYVKDFPVRVMNPGQAIYAEALMNPNFAAVICTGPAGSGKTYMATIYGYTACKNGDFIGVTVVPCESTSKLGALPGDLGEKMNPDVQPLKNALRNYLLREDAGLRKERENLRKFGADDAKKADGQEKRSLKAKLADRVQLIWDNWFSSIPIENARGRDFSSELAIYDEFQDQSATQADTLIKRLGRDGKIILTGDVRQIHAAYLDQFNNGLAYAARLLFDNPMVAQVCFNEDEVVRHPLVQLVAKRQEEQSKTEDTAE